MLSTRAIKSMKHFEVVTEVFAYTMNSLANACSSLVMPCSGEESVLPSAHAKVTAMANKSQKNTVFMECALENAMDLFLSGGDVKTAAYGDSQGTIQNRRRKS